MSNTPTGSGLQAIVDEVTGASGPKLLTAGNGEDGNEEVVTRETAVDFRETLRRACYGRTASERKKARELLLRTTWDEPKGHHELEEIFRRRDEGPQKHAVELLKSLDIDRIPGSHDYVRRALQSPHRLVRKQGIGALRKILKSKAGFTDALGILTRLACDDSSAEIRKSALAALVASHPDGEQMNGVLTGLLCSETLSRQDQAGRVLQAVDGDATRFVPGVIGLLAQENPLNRLRAYQALGRNGYSDQVRTLIPGLYQDPAFARLRRLIIEFCGECRPLSDELVSLLTEVLGEKEAQLRRAAARALGHVTEPSPEVIAKITDRLRDQHPGVRSAAAGALQEFGNAAASAVDTLTKTLASDQEWTVRVDAMAALGAIDSDPGVIDHILECLKDPNNLVRKAVFTTLRRMPPPAQPPEGLLVAFASPHPDVRIFAIRYGGEFYPDHREITVRLRICSQSTNVEEFRAVLWVQEQYGKGTAGSVDDGSSTDLATDTPAEAEDTPAPETAGDESAGGMVATTHVELPDAEEAPVVEAQPPAPTVAITDDLPPAGPGLLHTRPAPASGELQGPAPAPDREDPEKIAG